MKDLPITQAVRLENLLCDYGAACVVFASAGADPAVPGPDFAKLGIAKLKAGNAVHAFVAELVTKAKETP